MSGRFKSFFASMTGWTRSARPWRLDADSARAHGTDTLMIPPYVRDPRSPKSRVARALLTIAVVLTCLLYGVTYAVVTPILLPVLLSPIVALLFLVVWALPDTNKPPIAAMELFFFATVATMSLWPNYIAIALPGMPWITVTRLTGFPFAFFLAVVASTSRDFRKKIIASVGAAPIVARLLIAFTVIQLASILLSNNKSESVQKLVMALIYWTGMFLAAAFLFLRPGRAAAFAKILWAVSIPIGAMTLIEYKIKHVLWAGHIPSFLKIDDENVRGVLLGGGRAFTNKYRAKATFTTSLGLAEYMALTAPFIIHYVLNGKTLVMRAAAGASVPFVIVVILASGSRLGMVGIGLAVAIYGLVWALLRRRRHPGDLLASAITYAYPAFSVIGLLAILFVGRLHKMFLGGGAQTSSTEARITQWHMGIPLIIRNPFGYGIGRGAETLGYFDPGGTLTIDSYYLLILLEYGVVGFIVYYGMFAVAIVTGLHWGIKLSEQESEESLLIPSAIAMAAFLVIKGVFSNTDNHSTAFISLGMICALVHRSKQRFILAESAGVGRPGGGVSRGERRAELLEKAPHETAVDG
jgi:hypothetical protein